MAGLLSSHSIFSCFAVLRSQELSDSCSVFPGLVSQCCVCYGGKEGGDSVFSVRNTMALFVGSVSFCG